MTFKLEICSFDLQSALIARKAGADRIELCGGPQEGGITPGPGTILAAREGLDIELYPIIRPRGGDFLYNADEFCVMLKEVEFCKQAGCDGVVFGILQADGTVDKRRAGQLVERAYPMGVTFHRAFDWAVNPFEAMEDIIAIGCERILTSGQRPVAEEGAELINELVRQSAERIIIMPGSGVRSGNIASLKVKTGAREFHTSARVQAVSTMQYVNSAMRESQAAAQVDGKEVAAIRKILEGAGD